MLRIKPDEMKDAIESEINLLKILLLLIEGLPETEPLVYTQLEHSAERLQDLMLDVCEDATN